MDLERFLAGKGNQLSVSPEEWRKAFESSEVNTIFVSFGYCIYVLYFFYYCESDFLIERLLEEIWLQLLFTLRNTAKEFFATILEKKRFSVPKRGRLGPLQGFFTPLQRLLLWPVDHFPYLDHQCIFGGFAA